MTPGPGAPYTRTSERAGTAAGAAIAGGAATADAADAAGAEIGATGARGTATTAADAGTAMTQTMRRAVIPVYYEARGGNGQGPKGPLPWEAGGLCAF